METWRPADLADQTEWQERGNLCPMRGLGLRVLLSDFPDLQTSDGVVVGNVVRARREQELKKTKSGSD